MKCWAESVSECCSIQSGEHYVTKGLFSGKSVHLTNAPFAKGKCIEISKASMTRNCLCKKHNELLSQYDDEAINFARSLEYARDLSNKRRGASKAKLSVHNKYIDLDRFSRWYIKTFINLLYSFDYPSCVDEKVLASLVYSQVKIKNKVRFSLNMIAEQEFEIDEVVSISALHNGSESVGMQVELYGICFRGFFDLENQTPQKEIKIRFNDDRQRTSCIIHMV